MNPNEAVTATWVVTSPIEHDGVSYPIGAPFPFADPAIITPLRSAKSLKLREEVEAAEQLAADRARLEADNADLRTQLATALAAANAVGSKKSKASADEPPAV